MSGIREQEIEMAAGQQRFLQINIRMAESLSLMCMRIIRDKRSESELCPTIWYQVRLQE
mgnify:CR=1 FL=1